MFNYHYPATAVGECLQFWYHMHGSGSGSLAVYEYTGTLGTNLWERTGEQDDLWHKGSVTLKSDSSFFVSPRLETK